MKYRIGWPLWKLAYKLGFTMTYKVSFEYSPVDDQFQNKDKSIYTYTGHFDDLGFTYEAPTFEELVKEASSIAQEYVEMETHEKLKSHPIAILPSHIKGLA